MCGSREEDILKFHTISQDDFIGVTNFTMLIEGFINIETMKLVFLKYNGSRKKVALSLIHFYYMVTLAPP